MDKKSVFHAGAVWLEALSDFENELHEHVEQAKKDQLRFQDGRLEKSLVRHIKARASGKDEWLVLFACYQFVTNTTRHLGYDEARRMHGEEMKARRFLSAREFCRSLPERFAVAPERLLEELHFRVRSVVSWMEAQESFSLWLVFKDLRPAWRRKKLDARASAIQACYLSKLPQKLLIKTKRRGRVRVGAHLRPELGIGTNYENRPWNDREWQNILEQAARLTEKRYCCTELEKWVWWCYPVFRRYEWNTREVLDAASKRDMDFEKEKAGIDKLVTFQKYWIRRGLRFVGGKQKQNRTPPLWEFAVRVVLPEPGKMWGAWGGFLFLPKKN
jgi:hypothetical protein